VVFKVNWEPTIIVMKIKVIKYKSTVYSLVDEVQLVISEWGNDIYLVTCDSLDFVRGIGRTRRKALLDFYKNFVDKWWFIQRPDGLLLSAERKQKRQMFKLCPRWHYKSRVCVHQVTES